MSWLRFLPALPILLLVLGLLSLWSASHSFRYYPLQFLGELFSFDRDSERLSLPQAEPGRGDLVEMALIPAGELLQSAARGLLGQRSRLCARLCAGPPGPVRAGRPLWFPLRPPR